MPPPTRWQVPDPHAPPIPRQVVPRGKRRAGEEKGQMYREFYAVEDRALRRQQFAERVSERRRHGGAGHSLRKAVARRLFALAVVAERQETWNAVWERLEARGRL